MKCTADEAAEIEEEDEKIARATQTFPEDVGKSLGKPGQSPKSITELLEAIEWYIIHLEAFLGARANIRRMSASCEES